MVEMKNRICKMVILGIKQLNDRYYQGFAAQIAFYLMLSIVPILLLMTQILGLFNISVESFIGTLEQYFGPEVTNMLRQLFTFKLAGISSIIYLIVALWAGSRASFAITRITNYTLSEGETTGRPYFTERVIAIRTIIITIFTIVFSLIILAYGRILLEGLLAFLGVDRTTYADSIWMWLRWFVGFALYFFMVSYNYYILPMERMKYREVIPGSIFAAVGMIIVTLFYALYINHIADYDILYGALSLVVTVLLWFFLLSWVMCLGVVCNKVWKDTKDYDSSKEEHEGSVIIETVKTVANEIKNVK